MKKLMYIITVSISAHSLLKDQLKDFTHRGYSTFVSTSFSSAIDLKKLEDQEGIRAHNVKFQRDISIRKDFASLYELWRLLRAISPDITNVSTPKAGLLGGIAAALTKVPARVYTLRGLRLETVVGPRRYLLYSMEWLACACAHRVVCVSPSLRERVIQLRLTSPHKAVVLGSGSSNGLNAERFLPSPELELQTDALRLALALPVGTPTIGFVGRLVRDKGIGELVEAFMQLYAADPRRRLLLLGDYEKGDPVPPEVQQIIKTHPGIITTGFVPDTAPYYYLMDVLAFPTYREGYPNAPLEAAAAGRPVVTSDATGAIDAVLDGITGFTVPVGDAKALATALQRLLEDKQMAQKFGQTGQGRVSRDFQPEAIWCALDELYQELLVESQTRPAKKLKRIVDVGVSGAGLMVLMPLMVALTVIIRSKMGSPVLFTQPRPGLYGKPFTMYKFRTMRDVVDNHGQPLPDSERLTPLGRFLRASSLDELPGLFNVLRGNMSLVGPRPLLMEYLECYTPQQARRHEVRPGITGWAQVNGRNAISWEEKFKLDVWYVDNCSFVLDLKILWMTVLKVFKREGISASGEATMPKFGGRPGTEA